MTKAGLIYVRPVEGRTVRDNVTYRAIPPEGQWVQDGDPHYGAYLLYGDLVVAEPPAEPQPGPAPAAVH